MRPAFIGLPMLAVLGFLSVVWLHWGGPARGGRPAPAPARAVSVARALATADRAPATGYSQRLVAHEHAAAAVPANAIPFQMTQLAANELETDFARLLLERWAAAEPAAAAAWTDRLPASPARLALQQVVAVRWVVADPDRALDWLRQRPHGPGRETIALAMGGRIANTDPTVALLLAEELSAPFSCELRERALEAWAREEPFRAADFAARFLPAEESRRALIRIALTRTGSRARGDEAGALTGLARDWEHSEASPAHAR
ncbi:hypothetical protein DF3PB_30006 [uncultured Defluviicoccus sp.]|uniref:HEAT repeat domain-containing protein n=1 Tax=metagenome TaxID=256318 RepID=A0A380TFT2_9ZZZZ|nr:hypothetical protein DF3PB_30006 [uncultured Defluviicoccus sp.]